MQTSENHRQAIKNNGNQSITIGIRINKKNEKQRKTLESIRVNENKLF